MSTSFWVIFGIVLFICGYLFTKTVSNDAENDVKLRDILLNHQDYDTDPLSDNSKAFNLSRKKLSSGYEGNEDLKENVNIPKAEAVTITETSQYITTTHEELSSSSNFSNAEYSVNESDKTYVPEESYYQKDRCMVTSKVEEEDEEPKRQEDVRTCKSISETQQDLLSYSCEKEKSITYKQKGLLHYIKVFYKGMTFALGIPACLYGLYLFTSYTPTNTDKLIASVWVLIGVILLK